ncbi:MAG: response regulator [Desulfobulbaceae bacterium]|nr:response regulator [Desulfobulbaceae bacterium]
MMKKKPHKILIVEDEQHILDLISEIITELGQAPLMARDGIEALEILANDNIAIVLTDIKMPRMGGMQLFEHIRRDFPDTNVIVMTGYSDEFHFTDAIDLGAIDYLPKPFKRNELLAKLKRCLRERDLVKRLTSEVEKRKAIERDITRQKEFITSAINALTHPFYVIDVNDFTIKVANTASGYATDDALGQTCHSLTHKSDIPCNDKEHPCPVVEILKTKKPFSVEHIHFDEEGNERFIEVHGYPLFDQDGNVAQIIEYSLDITARKNIEDKLRQSEEKYRLLVEGTSDLITQTDAEGRFIFVNHVAKDVFGYSPKQCIGISFLDFVHPDDRQATEVWFRETVDKKIKHASFENRLVNQINDKVIHIRCSRTFHYDQDGKLLLVNSIARDISSRVKLQSELTRAKETAEKTVRLKSEFLANMSHEIRTPINVIMGMNRLALSTELTSDQRHYLTAVEKNSDLLLHLINDILDFSKIEAGQLDLEEHDFNLPDLMESIILPLRVIASDKGLDLNYNLPDNLSTWLIGDQYRLRQILTNLITNAVKFTDSGHIHVNIEKLSQKKGQLFLQFSVADTGQGIPETVQEIIFESFRQADSSVTRLLGGTGLGLAICKKLTLLMGGDIWLVSKPGKGSIFYFTLSLRQTDHLTMDRLKATVPSATMAQESTFLHILLVEDNLFNQDLAKIVLENQGHSVKLASSGLEALRRLADDSFDVILMDVQMPELDGISATRIIRRCEQEKKVSAREHKEVVQKLNGKYYGMRIPILAMTAHAMSGDRERCLEAGMDDYITKPFQPDEVHTALLRIVRNETTDKAQPYEQDNLDNFSWDRNVENGDS